MSIGVFRFRAQPHQMNPRPCDKSLRCTKICLLSTEPRSRLNLSPASHSLTYITLLCIIKITTIFTTITIVTLIAMQHITVCF